MLNQGFSCIDIFGTPPKGALAYPLAYPPPPSKKNHQHQYDEW